MTVETDTSLSALTTLRIGGSPRAVVRCSTPEAIVAVCRELDARGEPLLVVGGGSNLVVAEGEVDLTVVLVANDGISIDGARVVAGAGAVWDDVVVASINAGLGGVECLSGIPGSAGATPVQNVGAYGAEIADVLRRVQLYERATGEVRWVPAAELELAYRYSNLKFTQRAVVLAIELELTEDGLSRPLRFGQLAGEPGQRRLAAEVRREVLALRAAKGMVLDADDPDTFSAGSFFTNPVVPVAVADAVQERVRAERGDEDADRMPRWPVEQERVKLSAAWLIERAGFPRGFPGESAPARLSTKHTLALTNRGAATTQDIVDLAHRVSDGVREAFGVDLAPEPVWVGVAFERP
ncbi:UDP-N-acetylmuramate dehydrogenase [Corynebacterium uterequi]|uniref:UDP-N-acetylenolpyruvoylglucosamine reductase n=1 Tax=Corynebacterium uterequi TaxID=1072256 RepID=A0A0G3HGK0_9CORY|nr:UDP-N-acetylmuramate dehydrogenase [Corynebacterium uterequi]